VLAGANARNGKEAHGRQENSASTPMQLRQKDRLFGQVFHPEECGSLPNACGQTDKRRQATRDFAAAGHGANQIQVRFREACGCCHLAFPYRSEKTWKDSQVSRFKICV
jgi:hypothetical protein